MRPDEFGRFVRNEIGAVESSLDPDARDIPPDELTKLQAKARVIGDVTYRKLEMHLGAVVQGRLCHNEPGVAAVVELKRASGDSGATGATR